MTPAPRIVILGAGPAGLTAAYLLARAGRAPLVLEALPQVGGLSRTEVREGFRFDIGGHRFFTKSPEVQGIWQEVMGDELLLRRRLSRIYWERRFIEYPLRAGDLVRRLGLAELTRVSASYGLAVARGSDEAETFEEWVTQRFGRRLFEMFFRSYTEKVWGVPCSELRAEWAAQRIRGLSLASAARAAVFGGGEREHSLVTQFHYPRLGPGQMWERMAELVVEAGGEVRTSTPAERIGFTGRRATEVAAGGQAIPAEAVISSLPLRQLAGLADPQPPPDVLHAAAGLRYRDFMTVALALDGRELFPDNWIYVHDPGVRVARIQNFRAWSPAMVPDEGASCVGMEYFCFAGDDLWSRDDAELIDQAADELAAIGLAARDRVRQGWVVRVPQAYPIYDAASAAHIATVRTWLGGLENFQQVGRNGLHRYNNSDHSMLTAMRAVENLSGARHDVWGVNADSWYHETVSSEEQPYLDAGREVAPGVGL